MKKFIIERKLPGAGSMSAEELQAISKLSVNIVESLGKPYTWIESFVTEDAIYCVHEAESKEAIQQHSLACGFPVNKIEEIKAVIGPATAG